MGPPYMGPPLGVRFAPCKRYPKGAKATLEPPHHDWPLPKGSKMGVPHQCGGRLFCRGACMRDPNIFRPYSVPLIVGNFHAAVWYLPGP